MMDTVALVLKQDMFQILQPDRFTPSANRLFNQDYIGGRANMWCTQNPSQRELNNGIYKPRLTLTKRIKRQQIPEITLKIELSIPKLLFGNNFDELINMDFYIVVQELQDVLMGMGVWVTKKNIVNAPVSVIHYSKNIPLTDGSIPYSYLKEIQKSNISKRLDFNQTDFKNEGHSVKFRTNSFEIAWYDKLKEFEKGKVSKKRTEEDNSIQMKIFDKIKVRRPFEVLRMEIRLNRSWKIKRVLKQIELDIKPTFTNLFSKKISQKVLLNFLDLIEDNYPKTLYFDPRSTEDFIAQFLVSNSKATIRDTFTALGFHQTVKSIGAREIRELLKHKPISGWYDFIKKMNRFDYPKNKFSIFETIRKSIDEFIPLKLKDYEQIMSTHIKNI